MKEVATKKKELTIEATIANMCPSDEMIMETLWEDPDHDYVRGMLRTLRQYVEENGTGWLVLEPQNLVERYLRDWMRDIGDYASEKEAYGIT